MMTWFDEQGSSAYLPAFTCSHLFHCPKGQQGYWRFRNGKPFSGAWKNQQVTDCSKQDNFDTLRSLSCISLLSEAFSKLYTSCQVLLAISASCPHHLTFLGLLPLLHQMLDHLNSLSGGDGNRDWRGSVSVCWASHQSTSYKNSQFAWHLVAVIGQVTYIV